MRSCFSRIARFFQNSLQRPFFLRRLQEKIYCFGQGRAGPGRSRSAAGHIQRHGMGDVLSTLPPKLNRIAEFHGLA